MSRARLALVEPAAEKLFVGYGRVSADEQAKGESVEHQSQWDAEEAERLGGTMIAFFFDRPHTGTIVHGRPGLEAAVKFCADAGIGTIIARDTSRLHRNADEFREFERKVAGPAGVRFRTNIGHRHGGGVGSYVTTQSIDMAVTVYSMMLSDATRDGKMRLLMAGYWPAPPPIGYKRRERPKESFSRQQRRFTRPEDRELVPDPDWAPVIRRIFELAKAGVPKRQIAITLTDEGVPSPRAGGPWGKTTISHILWNPLYAGILHEKIKTSGQYHILYDEGGEPLKMKGEPLVDLETWQTVQGRKAAGAPARFDRYAFKGLLYTSHFRVVYPKRRAGQALPLLAKSHDDRVRYRPAHLLKHEYKVEPADDLAQYFPWALDAKVIDKLLIEKLISETQDDPEMVVSPGKPEVDDEAANLRNARRSNQSAQQAAKERLDTAIDMKLKDAAVQYDAELRRLKAEGEAIKTRLSTLVRRKPVAAPKEALHALREAWHAGNLDGCQRILRLLVSYVDIRVIGPPQEGDEGEWEVPLGFEVYLASDLPRAQWTNQTNGRRAGVRQDDACQARARYPARPG